LQKRYGVFSGRTAGRPRFQCCDLSVIVAVGTARKTAVRGRRYPSQNTSLRSISRTEIIVEERKDNKPFSSEIRLLARVDGKTALTRGLTLRRTDRYDLAVGTAGQTAVQEELSHRKASSLSTAGNIG